MLIETSVDFGDYISNYIADLLPNYHYLNKMGHSRFIDFYDINYTVTTNTAYWLISIGNQNLIAISCSFPNMEKTSNLETKAKKKINY